MNNSFQLSYALQNNRLLQHVLFWISIFVINVPRNSEVFTANSDPLYAILILDFCIFIPQIMASYFLAYYLIPILLFKRKYLDSLFIFIVATYFFSVLGRILVVHVGEELVRAKPFEQESILEILTDLNKLVFHYAPWIYSTSFMFLFVKYFVDFKRSKEKEILLSKERLDVELKTLKSQLHPHFLFNTLNNIYSLSLDNSPKTPVAIGKLSDILDHVLYKCNSQFVTLSSEIELLKNYIELEKLRYDERLEITFDTQIESDIEIPPLLLLSLVENAFKHGAGEDSGSPKIAIDVIQKANYFSFEISNTVSKEYTPKDKAKIGLSNVRKQLDLIYSNNYKLDTQLNNGFFKVILNINPIKS